MKQQNNMIIKSISLNNIRSYTKQRINFNEGITVLSGDIGSGKSTIMLAIEFALFGLLSNEAGTSLLRKGSNEGSVELTFSINSKEFTIQRTLKRKPEGIRQQNGAIIIDNSKQDMTPIELKQKIISLLGYPQESLAKKSLIYHFTTYTPQDEMKQILNEEPEQRISIIRKIFGIDKYERIVENSSLFARFLRESKKEMQGRIIDLDSKKSELTKINEEKENLLKKEKEIHEKLNVSKQKTQEIRKKALELEVQLKTIQELKKEKAIIEATIKQKENHQFDLLKEIEKAEKDINELKKNISQEKIEELKKKIKENIDLEINKLENELLQTQKSLAESEISIRNSEKIKNQIGNLNECPLCLQNVSHEHKSSITEKENTKINESNKKMLEINQKITEIKTNLQNKKNELNESRNAEKELSLIKMQIKNISEKEALIIEKKKLQEKNSIDIKEQREKMSKIIVSDFEKYEKEYAETRNEFEKALAIERSCEIEKAKINSEINSSIKMKEMFEKEIYEKEKTKTKLNEVSKIESWISKKFTDTIIQMEKHVLGKIYFTFNEQFKELFGVLIDDERLSSKIDETFTPKIEQNGYETEFQSLSGGEKTSIAMAYRLALHTAISKMINTINTRGLLLLDEPTDGFSSEQIDSMKDLFEKISANQAIIVSHESKIESVADQVVRIVKTGHESVII